MDSSGTLSFLRDGQKLVAEKTEGGVLAARYVNEGDSLYSWLVSDKQDTTRRYPTFDLLGTVHDFVGSGQTLLGSNLFEAYGTRPAAASGTVTGPYGYVGALGYHLDPDPALHLLSIRHYNSRIGAFVSRDRIQGEPPLCYSRNRPTSAVDPAGRRTCQGTWSGSFAPPDLASLFVRVNCDFVGTDKCGWCDYAWRCTLNIDLEQSGGTTIGAALYAGLVTCGISESLFEWGPDCSQQPVFYGPGVGEEFGSGALGFGLPGPHAGYIYYPTGPGRGFFSRRTLIRCVGVSLFAGILLPSDVTFDVVNATWDCRLLRYTRRGGKYHPGEEPE